MPIEIKIAENAKEFKQIERLNYETFVEEIPQHTANSEKILKDKFHPANTYIIALTEGELTGMMSINGSKPFSIDHKLQEMELYLPSHTKKCEIRLLAVKKNRRGGRIFSLLMNFMKKYALASGYDLAVISGTTRQLKLYMSIGFIPFGPLVGKEDAFYQPMYLTKENFLTLHKNE